MTEWFECYEQNNLHSFSIYNSNFFFHFFLVSSLNKYCYYLLLKLYYEDGLSVQIIVFLQWHSFIKFFLFQSLRLRRNRFQGLGPGCQMGFHPISGERTQSWKHPHQVFIKLNLCYPNLIPTQRIKLPHQVILKLN